MEVLRRECTKIIHQNLLTYSARTFPMKYSTIGGLASIPLTVLLYWQSGMGNNLSLSMVFFGGLLAGYLSHRRQSGETNAGFRAGVIGGAPVLWLSLDLFRTTLGPVGPLWFRVIATMTVLVFIVIGFLISAFIGILGAKVGRWLAGTTDSQRMSVG
ncbi:DUF5518 domain-containing protein [Haladaptatus paucihalophilus]